MISAPSYESLLSTIDSVCLSVRMSVTNFILLLFCNRAIFWPSILHDPLYKTFFDFWFKLPNAQNLLPKICTKSPISQLVWQIDRRCLGLLGSFGGWPIQWNHAKCCGPILVAMVTKFGLGAEIQSPIGLSVHVSVCSDVYQRLLAQCNVWDGWRRWWDGSNGSSRCSTSACWECTKFTGTAESTRGIPRDLAVVRVKHGVPSWHPMLSMQHSSPHRASAYSWALVAFGNNF